MSAFVGKNSQISIQIFFFILMSILMVWIIYFGISKMFIVNDTISEQERIQLKQDLKDAFDFCTDPLNLGSFKRLEIKTNKITGVCAFNNKINTGNSKLDDELKILKSSGDNLAIISKNNIIDSFKVNSKNDFCEFREDNKNFEVKINC